jgi:NTE family protein
MTPSVPRAPIDPCYRPRAGLVLTGGGARSAYQVGVLRAIASLLPPDAPSPFPIVTGMSAGAIVAAAVACHASRFREGAVALERVWRNFHVEQVFRADQGSMLRAALRWLLAFLSTGRLVRPPESLFDSSPLRRLLEQHYDFGRMREAMGRRHLDVLAIAVSSYRTARSVTFYESRSGYQGESAEWTRGVRTALAVEHLLASSAVPFLFPAIRINAEYHGDGAMRQVAPLSPAIQLGADSLLVIGVRSVSRSVTLPAPPPADAPSVGQIIGFMLDTLFIDSLQSSVAQLERINRLLVQSTVPNPEGLRHIDALVITPRVDFSEIAIRHARALPRTLRALLRTIGGASAGGAELLSYLLFESSYTRELIAVGMEDAMARADDMRAFLEASRRENLAHPRKTPTARLPMAG